MEEVLNKKLRALQKRATKISLTEAITTPLNADQRDLLSKKPVTLALIDELKEQFSLLVSFKSQAQEVISVVAPSTTSPDTSVKSTIEVELEAKVASLEHAVTKAANTKASFMKSVSVLCEDLLSIEDLSDHHFTLLKSVQTLLSSSTDTETTAEQMQVLVNAPRPARLEPKASHAKSSSQDTIINQPIFINESELDSAVVDEKYKRSAPRVVKQKKDAAPPVSDAPRRSSGKVERKAPKTVEEKLASMRVAAEPVDVAEVVEEKPKMKSMNYVVGAKGGLKKSTIEA